MKRALIIAIALAALVALPAAGWAQGRPNFSGTWTMDQARSDPAPARGAGGGGGRRGGGGGGRRAGGGRMGGGGMDASMTIKQSGTELTIERAMGQRTQTAVYKLDGSESTNSMGPIQAKSKASWDGSKLVIKTTQRMQGRGREMTIDSKDVYSLDGDVLTLETTRDTPNGEQTRKVVYNKGR